MNDSGQMANFTIDGKEIEVVPGRNVLMTALDHGVHIPHYCYHPGLSAPANCRMCLVEIEANGRRGLLPSCTAMPTEGMVVETQSELVRETQEAVMEFLLINHPLDCPICDQAGECDLQDYSYAHGAGEGRFFESKSIQPKKDIGKHTLLYSDRCIRCTRCIRFCDEISGTGELGYFNRGVHNEVDIFPGMRLDNRLSGNTVDICPVGALLDKEFLFKQRVWFLKGVDTICPGCSTGCNIRADMNNERIYRLVPRENRAVNDFWMCDDGRHGWGYIHSENRLFFPLVGKEEAEDLVLWKAALERVKEGLERVQGVHGGEAVAGVITGHATNEEQFLFGRLFASVLGGGPVAIRTNASPEGDVTFKSGFTIRSEKSPNARGAAEVLRGVGLAPVDVEEIWTGIESGRIKALYYLNGDPEATLTRREIETLGKLDFLVVQDISSNELSQGADVVLAGASFVEKDGTFTNHDGRVQRIRRGLAPPGDAKADWEILRDLLQSMGSEAGYDSAGDVLHDLADSMPAFEGISYENLGDQGRSLN